jgi:outer membrane protein TolC
MRLVPTTSLLAIACLLQATAWVQAETLTDSWAYAVANNGRLAATQLDQVATEYQRDAIAAARKPNVTVRGSYRVRSGTPSFRISDPLLGAGDFQFPYAQHEAAGSGGQVKLPIYTSGKTKNAILGAEARVGGAKHHVDRTRMELLLAVGQVYLEVLRAQRDLEVADQNVASLTAHEREVQGLFSQQRVPRNDLLAAKVVTAAARQDQLRQQNVLMTARARYNRTLGVPLFAEVQLEELSLARISWSLEQSLEIAWQRRPDLLQLQAARQANLFEACRLRAAGLPQVSAVGAYLYEENRYNTPQTIASAAVVVDWNVFDGGRSRRSAAAQRTRAASVGRQMEDLKAQISLELLTAWNNRHEASARLDLAICALEYADENLRVVRLRYTRGMEVGSEVLDAQKRRTEAARDQYHAGYDLSWAQLQLRFAAGTLGDELSECTPPH